LFAGKVGKTKIRAMRRAILVKISFFKLEIARNCTGIPELIEPQGLQQPLISEQ
jgi:hypothetical protein